MAQYTKKWLSAEEQLAKLERNGVMFGDHEAGIQLPKAVGVFSCSQMLSNGCTGTRFQSDLHAVSAEHPTWV